MPAKKEERGAEIDSCSLKISEEKIKILLYAWEKVYTYGDAESMCTDGIILNRYRQERKEKDFCENVTYNSCKEFSSGTS